MRTDVLVVDDEDAVRRTEADILRAAGFAVAEAADGLQALELLRSERVGAVVLDVTMPGIDGITLAATLEDPPPIVFVTARTLAPADLVPVAGKVDAVLTKPVAPDTLLEQVRSVLQGGCR